MKKFILLLTALLSFSIIKGQSPYDLSLYLENCYADTTNLLAPEVFDLPCSEYFFSYYRGGGDFGGGLTGLDSLFAIAQPYNTDTVITLDGIVIYDSYFHYCFDTTSAYCYNNCDPTSLYCEILDSNLNSIYHIRYDTINQNSPATMIKHYGQAITFFALNFDTLINIKPGRFYVTITFGKGYRQESTALVLMDIPVSYFSCDTLVYDYPLPLFQLKNNPSWNTTYRGARIPYMSVYPRLNTTGYIAGSSDINNINQEEFDFDIFPNPAKEEVNINCGYKIKSLQVYDEQGKVLLEKEVNAYNYQINLNTLPQGTYFIKVITNSGQTVKKIIRN